MSWQKSWEWIRTWCRSAWNKAKNMKKDQFLILILVGVLLLVISLPTGDGKKGEGKISYGKEGEKSGSAAESSAADSGTEEGYEKQMEERLAAVLAAVDGVGRVKVMITLEGSGEAKVLKDTPTVRSTTNEADSAGGTRTSMELETTETTVYTTDEQGNQVPYIRCETEPAIRGILIVAEGGGNPVTAAAITEAAEALFQLEPHRIRVMKMKIQG